MVDGGIYTAGEEEKRQFRMITTWDGSGRPRWNADCTAGPARNWPSD